MTQAVASEDDLRVFCSIEETSNTNKQLKMKVKDEENYIPHVPSDYHSEKGLSVVTGTSFDSQAASAVLDLDADDREEGRAHREKMKW